MTDITKLKSAFDNFAYGQSLHNAFVEILDWTLLPFKQFDDPDLKKAAFEKYQTHPKVEKLVKIVTIIGDLSEGFCDPLGELFMQAISNGHNGQYFTPEHLCDLMAMLNIGQNGKDNEKIADPACGSGRTLLAAAKINRHAQFYGADLDGTCCKMALLNMLFNSLTGEIAQMNTLSNQFFTGFEVKTLLVNGYHMPYYIEFTDPKLSYICLQDPKPTFTAPFNPVRADQPINGIQGSLF